MQSDQLFLPNLAQEVNFLLPPKKKKKNDILLVEEGIISRTLNLLLKCKQKYQAISNRKSQLQRRVWCIILIFMCLFIY